MRHDVACLAFQVNEPLCIGTASPDAASSRVTSRAWSLPIWQYALMSRTDSGSAPLLLRSGPFQRRSRSKTALAAAPLSAAKASLSRTGWSIATKRTPFHFLRRLFMAGRSRRCGGARAVGRWASKTWRLRVTPLFRRRMLRHIAVTGGAKAFAAVVGHIVFAVWPVRVRVPCDAVHPTLYGRRCSSTAGLGDAVEAEMGHHVTDIYMSVMGRFDIRYGRWWFWLRRWRCEWL